MATVTMMKWENGEPRVVAKATCEDPLAILCSEGRSGRYNSAYGGQAYMDDELYATLTVLNGTPYNWKVKEIRGRVVANSNAYSIEERIEITDGVTKNKFFITKMEPDVRKYLPHNQVDDVIADGFDDMYIAFSTAESAKKEFERVHVFGTSKTLSR